MSARIEKRMTELGSMPDSGRNFSRHSWTSADSPPISEVPCSIGQPDIRILTSANPRFRGHVSRLVTLRPPLGTDESFDPVSLLASSVTV